MKNKIALIIGGTSGIGLETAKILKKRGCSLLLVSRHAGPHELGESIQVDLYNKEQVNAISSLSHF